MDLTLKTIIEFREELREFRVETRKTLAEHSHRLNVLEATIASLQGRRRRAPQLRAAGARPSRLRYVGLGLAEAARRLLDVPVTPSIGTAIVPDDAGDAGSLVRAANAAMFRAKTSGKKSVRVF